MKVKIAPITVKDKNDVVKVLTILEKLGITIMSEEQKNDYLVDEQNNFMIQEDDDGFGISIESLEKHVDDVLKTHPDICGKINEIEFLTNSL